MRGWNRLVGGVAGGLATSYPLVLAARVAEGLAAGVVQPIPAIIIMRSFRFIKGPVFANLVLADEINRTPPKTQAALLQSMQEYRVTAGGVTHDLPLPFLVFATQNPIEQEGTYPLPEAQLDRFMFQIDVDYPTEDEEAEIVRMETSAYRANVVQVLSPQQILELQALVRRVPVADHVVKYAAASQAAW